MRQADELGCYIATEEAPRITKVWVSPMRRARQTLDAIEAACTSQPLPVPTVRDDLREIELHTWEGKLKSEVLATGWGRWKADPAAFVMDDGARPLPDLWERAVGNWAELRKSAPVAAEATLVVSHGALGRCMVAAALGGSMASFKDPSSSSTTANWSRWPGSRARPTRRAGGGSTDRGLPGRPRPTRWCHPRPRMPWGRRSEKTDHRVPGGKRAVGPGETIIL